MDRNAMILRLTELAKAKEYKQFSQFIKSVMNDYELYIEFLDEIIGYIEEIFYAYKSEDYIEQNRLELEYDIIFSDAIEFLYEKYAQAIGERELFTKKENLQLMISVSCIYSLSYKYEEQTRLLQKIVDSDIVTDFETKKYALHALLAPDCRLYLTNEEWAHYIEMNDTQPYGGEIHDVIRHM